MKKCILAAFIGILGLLNLSSCYAARVDGPYEGRVIDADTGAPIEGVVVLGTWSKEYRGAGGAVSKYHDAMETVTDKNGEFKIEGLGLQVISNVLPINVLIFKSGYEYESGFWTALKKYAKKVKWEGNKAIIPLKKLTMEERKKSATFPPSPTTQAPEEKIKMMMEEIRKERKERGLD
jgi:hypothetical protein